MEMSLDYMRETAEHLRKAGFELKSGTEELGRVGTQRCFSHTFQLTREAISLVLETVQNPEVGERYFLELKEYHRLSSFSFPLDSWKFKESSIEFKYYALPDDGRGLSFVLSFDEG